MKTYQIKPLKWEGGESDGYHSYNARTPFGSFTVGKFDEDDSWKWSYCFDEYYDESSEKCDSLEDGFRLAEAYWVDRLSGALIEIDGKPLPHCPGCSPREKNNLGATHCGGTIEHPEVT